MQVTNSAAIHHQMQRIQLASEHGLTGKPTTSSPPTAGLQTSGFPTEPISDSPAKIITSHQPVMQTEGRPTTDKPDNHVEALLADWGATDSRFDLDGDGTVGTRDLMLLLGRIANGGNDGGQTPPADDGAPGHRQLVGHIADTVLANQDQDGDGLLTVADLGNRPGLFERLDSDGDGVVGQADLTKMISEHLQQTLHKNPDLSPREYAQRVIDFFDREREPALSTSFAGPTPTITADNSGDVIAETPILTVTPQISNTPVAGLTTSADPVVAETPTLTIGAPIAADSSAASFAERVQEMFAEVFGNRSSTLRQYADMSFDPVARALAHRAESVGPEAIRNFIDHADLSPSQKDTLLSRVSTYLGGLNVVG